MTIAAGQTSAQVTIDVPQSALGTLPDANLGLQVTAPDGNSCSRPRRDRDRQPAARTWTSRDGRAVCLEQLGTFTHVGNAYTLDLAGVAAGSLAEPLQFAIANTATAPADSLSGTFSPPTGSGFIVTGNNISQPVAPNADYAGLYFVATSNNIGSEQHDAVVHAGYDVNDSGYCAAARAVDPDRGRHR